MTPAQYARVVDACRHARGRGIRIVTGDWSVVRVGNAYAASNGCACPLGALLVDEGPLPPDVPQGGDWQAYCAALLLDVPQSNVDAFTEGIDFDGPEVEEDGSQTYDGADLDWFEAGCRMRRELAL